MKKLTKKLLITDSLFAIVAITLLLSQLLSFNDWVSAIICTIVGMGVGLIIAALIFVKDNTKKCKIVAVIGLTILIIMILFYFTIEIKINIIIPISMIVIAIIIAIIVGLFNKAYKDDFAEINKKSNNS